MKRSLMSVGVVAVLAVVASSAHAQPFTITKPVPTTVRPVSLNVPAQAYTTNTTLAGVPGRTGNLDSRPTWSTFNFPTLVTTDSAKGATYVVDVINESVRVIVGGRMETFATRISAMGSATGVAIDPTNETLIFTLRGDNKLYSLRRGGQWLVALPAVEVLPTGTIPARFSSLGGIIRDEQGSFYISDTGNHSIRKMTRGGVVTTFAQGGLDFAPQALARDARDGSIYAVSGFAVYRAAPTGQVGPYAGNPGARGLTDGFAASAQLNDPRGIAVDAYGRVFVADAQTQADGTSRGFIRQIAIVPPSPVIVRVGVQPPQSGPYVTTLAFQGSGAVAAIPVALSRPNGLSMWANQLVVADSNLHTVDILH